MLPDVDWATMTPLALLGLFVIGAAVFIGKWLQKEQTFTQGLITSAAAQQKEHTEAWKELTQLAVKVQEGTIKGISEVQEAIKEHEQKAERRHEKVERDLQQLLIKNGKTGK